MLVRGRFDAARTTPDNRRHWANADGLSADAAASPDVRQTLRNRSRYEVANNSYARGIVLTLANDCVGTGPRLQLLAGDSLTNRLVERAFADWAREIRLAEKLRTMRMAKATDGEAFAILTANPNLASPIKLDVRLVEADRVTNPDLKIATTNAIDGIEFDRYGNPKRYFVMREHPGAVACTTAIDAYDRIPAEAMIHWFRTDRPGQHRGIPEITPALPLFAQLRRYTLAVLGAAESAANIAILMKTSAPAGGESAEVEPMTEMEFVPNMAVFTPEGWEPSQIKAEQPATTYDMFKRELLNEIARCLNMPFNIAAGNSSGYNYASGRLDHQTYFKSIRIEQADCDSVVLDRILTAWMGEAELLTEFSFLRGMDELAHQWFWDGTEHVDPAKEAMAQEKRLANNTTTLAAEYARQGKDWETELRQRAKEKQLMDELGLSAAEATPRTEQESDTDVEDQRQAA